MTPERANQHNRNSYNKFHDERLEKQNARNHVLAEKIREYKTKLVCFRCNKKFEENPADCAFHHINDKDKNFNPSQAPTFEQFIAEVAKCVPLCIPCHNSVEAILRRRKEK